MFTHWHKSISILERPAGEAEQLQNAEDTRWLSRGRVAMNPAEYSKKLHPAVCGSVPMDSERHYVEVEIVSTKMVRQRHFGRRGRFRF
jgi:hypothetical protein